MEQGPRMAAQENTIQTIFQKDQLVIYTPYNNNTIPRTPCTLILTTTAIDSMLIKTRKVAFQPIQTPPAIKIAERKYRLSHQVHQQMRAVHSQLSEECLAVLRCIRGVSSPSEEFSLLLDFVKIDEVLKNQDQPQKIKLVKEVTIDQALSTRKYLVILLYNTSALGSQSSQVQAAFRNPHLKELLLKFQIYPQHYSLPQAQIDNNLALPTNNKIIGTQTVNIKKIEYKCSEQIQKLVQLSGAKINFQIGKPFYVLVLWKSIMEELMLLESSDISYGLTSKLEFAIQKQQIYEKTFIQNLNGASETRIQGDIQNVIGDVEPAEDQKAQPAEQHKAFTLKNLIGSVNIPQVLALDDIK